MSEEQLDALLERMTLIAAAVNAFKSEAVQQQALTALVSAFEGASGAKAPPVKSEDPSNAADGVNGDSPKETSSKGQRQKRVGTKDTRGEWKLVKDLDLRPEGKQSFDDFVAAKQPGSNEDKYPIVVYYIGEILGITPVTLNHVGTAFRLKKEWKEPTDVASGLRTASSRKGTLDTSSYENIKLTPAGRNFVEHDLPPKGGKAK